jgi:hypothetical protein
MGCFTRNIAKPSAGSPSLILDPRSSRARLELTAAGTLHTAATARSESFQFVLISMVTWRRVPHLDLVVCVFRGMEFGRELGGHDTRCMQVGTMYLSEPHPSEDGSQAATGTNHQIEKESTRSLAGSACGTASSDPRPHSCTVHDFRVTHTNAAFCFCWLIAWAYDPRLPLMANYNRTWNPVVPCTKITMAAWP